MVKVNSIGKNPTQIAGGFMKSFAGWKRPEIIDKLKSETDELHHVLQGNKIFDGLTGENPSVDKYKKLLMRFLPFYSAVEQKLDQVCDWKSLGLNFDERKKSHLIEKDLQILGISDKELNLIPACHESPSLSTVQEALGCLYVLEGATLGAQLMAKNMNVHFGYDTDSGCAFLKCYGEGPSVGLKFKEMAEFIGKNSSTDDENKIINSAKVTFESLDRWLSKD